jgi:dTDP-4-amino-4,6-dideoxygalactose transaminase
VPVFVDVDAGTGLIDPPAVDAAVGPGTRAILAVHLYGQMCDMDALGAIARRHGLLLLEDAAQAHGATWRGRRAGSIGIAGAFSFYPSKNLGALGDAGAITTSDAHLAEVARRLRNLGRLGKADHALPGFNERLDGLQAAFLRAKLPHLDRWNDARRASALTYQERLGAHCRLLVTSPHAACVYHLFPVRSRHRDALAERLRRAGVETAIHYRRAVPDLPPFARDGAMDLYPVARAWASEELSLPMSEHLSAEQLEHVVDGVLAASPA